MKKISELGTIMGIWAHPDDETYSMGGLFALASRLGLKTVCITATRGEQGVQDESRWPQNKLAEIRTDEMAAAMGILGVEHHHWLEYSDGGCQDVAVDEPSTKIAQLINIHKPDTIFTFGPDGMTGHDDHRAVSSWASRAVELSSRQANIYHTVMIHDEYAHLNQADTEFNMFFNTDQPNSLSAEECDLLIELEDEILDIKMLALEAMPSQTESLLLKHKKSVRLSGRTEGFVLLKSH